MPTSYKIYLGLPPETEYLPSDVVKKHFDAATLDYQYGLWKGKEENNCIIEIIDLEDAPLFERSVGSLAKELASVFKQEWVLVTETKLQAFSFHDALV